MSTPWEEPLHELLDKFPYMNDREGNIITGKVAAFVRDQLDRVRTETLEEAAETGKKALLAEFQKMHDNTSKFLAKHNNPFGEEIEQDWQDNGVEITDIAEAISSSIRARKDNS